MIPDYPLGEFWRIRLFVESLSNHEQPFDKLRANGFVVNG